ncbi:hypothetical protein ALC60_11446 [Trachymyrmex zeteki]|uniref:Reverse transcriptase domain-containing protein n=1 Tax=Mycetomoellerius zeteki TaxID=64791 RepID=A0A151WNT3_9HYME|nr:hypothetical protein ALC60_11446 [Trachymyrmex zeteki]
MNLAGTLCHFVCLDHAFVVLYEPSPILISYYTRLLCLNLHRIINDSILEAPSYIKNSFHLIKKLKEVRIEPDHSIVSFDVISLFTNVPVDLVSDGITKTWDYIAKKLQKKFIQ